jgi:hypothetical protein
MEFYEGPPVDLTGLKENKTFSLDIPLRTKVTTLDPGKVEVKVEIVPSSTRSFEQVPITIVGQNDVYDTKVTAPANGNVSLTLEGAPTVLEKLKLQDVQAIVDVSNLPPGKHEVTVNVNVSPFVRKAGAELKATVEISARTTPTATPTPTPGGGAGGGTPGTGNGANNSGAGGTGGNTSVPATGNGTSTPTPTPTPTPSPTGTPVPSPSPSGATSSNTPNPGTGTVTGMGSGTGGKDPNGSGGTTGKA